MTEEKSILIEAQIKNYIFSQPEPKRGEIQALHQRILQALPSKL